MLKRLKKQIKEIPKKTLVLMMTIAMLFSYFAPITNTYAQEYGTGNYMFGIDLARNDYPVSSVKINNNNWNNVNDRYYNTTNSFTVEIVTGMKGDSYPDISYAGGLDEIVSKSARVEEDNIIFTLEINGASFTNPDSFNTFGMQIVDGPPIDNTVRATANISINISGSDIEYHYVESEPDNPDVVRFKFAINADHIEEEGVPFTFGNATFKNGVMPPNATGVSTTNPIEYEYNYDGSGTVDFFFVGATNIEYSKLEINGVNYANQTPHTKDEIYEHHIGRALQFWINDVPYNEDGYNIVVEGSKLSNEKLVGSFGWNYKKDTEPDYDPNEDSLFTHGKLEFVEVKYTDLDNVSYTFDNVNDYNSAKFHGTGEIYEWHDGNKAYTDRRDAWGEALVPYGAELTIRVVPDPGYQLVRLTNSSAGFTTTDEVGVYKIVFNEENMGNGADNFHLGAVFEEVSDEVIPNSVNVKSGNIETDTNFENGTAKLEVNDVASMSPSRMEGFENLADEEGYELENYLDISLYNSIYKGGKKDLKGNYESWDTPVESIDANATITLELVDDMSGKDLAIVHETHNGNEFGYELIDVIYNEENNTVTFETNSFSNYAIISKNINNDSEEVVVYFDSNGGSNVKSISVPIGETITEPESPTNGDMLFDGWYEDEELEVRFDFNTPITNEKTLYAKWIENEDTQKYIIEDENGNTISFIGEKNREYSLTMIDYLSFTDEELTEMGIKDMFDELISGITNAVKESGTLLCFYQIEVENDDNFLIHEGPFNIKIKMTDEMKKYNTFKIIYIDADNGLNMESPIELKVEGDYLVGTLNHLSTYAITGSYVKPAPTNPLTGDNIYIWTGMLFISVIGLSIGTITVIKRKKQNV